MAADALPAPERAVLDFLENSGTVRPGDTVIAAVSGGADSMCLLTVFNKYSSQYGLNMIAAHFEHGIRAEDSLRDAEFVKRACRELGIELRTGSGSVPLERRRGESVETCARRLRYTFLESIDPNAWIATAHNADDNAETMLLSLARGTGMRGLCGIPPVRGRIIRPLLTAERSQIEAYLRDAGVSFVTDATNEDDVFSRNLIRHQAVPALRSVSSAAVRAMARCAESLRIDEDYLTKLAYDAITGFDGLSADAEALSKLHPAVGVRAVRALLERWGCLHAEKRHIDELRLSLPAECSVNLPGDFTVRIENGRIYPAFHAEPVAFEPEIADYTVGCVPVRFETTGKLALTNHTKKEISLAGCADEDALTGSVLRTAEPGDRFLHGGSGRLVRLFGLLAEVGVPPGQRASVPVLCRGDRILWSAYAGVSGDALPTRDSDHIVYIHVPVVLF